jgi:uncharacterized membrane protein YedE/YeeE
MREFILQPWPWYVVGPLLGLTVPVLLIMGNKQLGISSSFRHICASCFPANISFFRYDWKKEVWNLFFAAGILLGGFIAARYLGAAAPIRVNAVLVNELNKYGVNDYSNLLPAQLFSFSSLLTIRGFILMVIGGFLVGFGTRYAGGCTSGHSIMGLSTLQWPSLVATVCFLTGGFIVSNLVLPFILRL